MDLVILKMSKWQTSKHGSEYRYLFMKDEETGKSYKTCLFKEMRNFSRWVNLMAIGNVIGGCRVRSGNLIDADSQVWLKGKVELKDD